MRNGLAEGANAERLGGAVKGIPTNVQNVLAGPGQPLDSKLRQNMECRFEHDFSRVRVHTEPMAGQAANELGAAAFTVGSHVAFKTGAYAPGTSRGRRLIAHELAHVTQNQANPGLGKRLLSRRDDAAEIQADHLASLAERSEPVGSRAAREPSALISLAPETWFRGEAEGVSQVPGTNVEGGHDLGDGLYLTDNQDVANNYADTRIAENKLPPSAKRVLAVDIDLEKVRVLDVSKDPRWAEFVKRPALPGGAPGTPTKGDLMKMPRNYNSFFREFCRENQIKVEEFDVIIGPETVRSGRQMCIRNPTIAEEVRKSLATAKPPGGRGPGSSGNGGDSKGESEKSGSVVTRPGAEPVEPGGDPKPGATGQAVPAEPAPRTSEPGTGTLGPGEIGPRVKGDVAAGPDVFGPEAEAADGAAATSGLDGTITSEAELPRAAGAAAGLALLAGFILYELYVEPALAKQREINRKIIADYEEKKRREIQAHLSKAANYYLQNRAGQILKSCYFGMLRQMEKAGKPAYVRMTLKVTFKDSRIFGGGDVTSITDITPYDTELISVEVSDRAEAGSATPLLKAGKDPLFHDDLYEQNVSFSLPAPTAAELEKAFGKDAGEKETSCSEAKACFIATACYGSSEGKELEVLRAFRDRVLWRTRPGRAFVRTYYRRSPRLAIWLSMHPAARTVVRECFVTPLVKVARYLVPDN